MEKHSSHLSGRPEFPPGAAGTIQIANILVYVADFEVSPPTYCDFEEQLDIKKDKSPMATLGPSIRRLLRRTFRWVSIIRRMDVFEDSEKSISTEPIHKTNDIKDQKLHIKRS